MNCVDFFFQESKNLEKKLILGRYEEISYRECYEKILGLASYLNREIGFRKEVIIMADNSVFFVISYFAIMKSENIAVPLDPNIDTKNLDYIIKLCKPEIAFCQENKLSKLEGNGIKIINEKNYYNLLSEKRDFDGESGEEKKGEEIAEIIFTSGSTGLPKGVILSHKNLIANTLSIISYLNLKPDDIAIVVLPFFYCYGLSVLHTHIRVGGSLVFNKEFIFFSKLFEDINKYNCTSFAGVPSHFQLLLRKSNFKELDFPSLRYVTQAGGKLSNIFIKEFIDCFPNVKFFIMYGQTEATARLSYLPSEEISNKLGSIGKGILGVKLEIIDKKGNSIKPGEVGEIIASGDSIMKGYYNNPEETSKMLKNGKLHTGDLATIDEEGFIYIVGREKEIVKVGGFRVSPKEVEGVINQIKEIIDCTVIGIEDELSGEALKAFVVLDKNKPSISKESILNHCKKNLQSHKIPKFIEIIDEIPTNDVGKKVYDKIEKIKGKTAEEENKIEDLINQEQFIIPQNEKERLLLPIAKKQLKIAYENNQYIKSWLDKLKLDIDKIDSLAEVPLLPTQMFKWFDLKTCEGYPYMILESSATTSGVASKVALSKETAIRQSKALVSIIKNHISNKRYPLLVIDAEPSTISKNNLTARGAAIRGLSMFAREVCYAFEDKDNKLVMNNKRVNDFCKRNKDKEILVFGFTFILWTKLINESENLKNIEFNFKDVKIIHSGGWKKLENEKVSKEEFSEEIARLFNTKKENVLDFYGMAEQTGVIFMDCEASNKHVPNFADIIIRNYYTLEENKIGEEGYIEIINLLPDSYPGMSVLTEDAGEIVGIDDCPCGRKGKYFKFKSRIEKAEIRGCGDTFKEG